MLQFFKSLFLDEPINHPFQTKKQKSVKPKPAKQKVNTDNIVHSGGFTFVRKQTESGFEDERIDVATIQTNGNLTDNDRKIIVSKNLNPDNYAKVKTYYARGWSAGRTAKELSGQRGFGERTLDKYWAAMSSVGVVRMSSPTR